MVDWKSGSKGKEHTVNTHTENTDDTTREATRRAADRAADTAYNRAVTSGLRGAEAEEKANAARQAFLVDDAKGLAATQTQYDRGYALQVRYDAAYRKALVTKTQPWTSEDLAEAVAFADAGLTAEERDELDEFEETEALADELGFTHDEDTSDVDGVL